MGNILSFQNASRGRGGAFSREGGTLCSNSKSMLTFFKFTFFNSFFGNREGGTFSQEGRTLCSYCICTAWRVTDSVANNVGLKHPAQSREFDRVLVSMVELETTVRLVLDER